MLGEVQPSYLCLVPQVGCTFAKLELPKYFILPYLRVSSPPQPKFQAVVCVVCKISTLPFTFLWFNATWVSKLSILTEKHARVHFACKLGMCQLLFTQTANVLLWLLVSSKNDFDYGNSINLNKIFLFLLN